MTTQNARYQLAQRDLESLAVANLKLREMRWAGDTRRNVGKLQDGTAVYEAGYSTRYIERFGSLAAAVSAFGSSAIHGILSSAMTLTADLTLPATTALEIPKGGSIDLNGFTLTLEGPLIAGNYQVFTGSGLVLYNNASVDAINILWYGADGTGVADSLAPIQAALTSAKYSDYIHKVLVPGGFYRVSSRLEINRNAVWLQGVGRQASFFHLDADTALTMGASGYTNAIAGDIGKTVTCSTVLLRLDPLTFTNAVAGDIGKTVTGTTSLATGRLVRYSNNLAEPFYEVVALTGTFQNAETVSVTAGTGTGTTNLAPEARTNTGILKSYDNATRVWTIKGTAGFFWNGMSCTITSGTGVGRLSADPVDSTDACIKVSPSTAREYVAITDIGFTCAGRGAWSAVDAHDSPNVILQNLYSEGYGTGIRLGNAWNACVENCNLVLCRNYGVNATSNTNDTCFLNMTITCDDKIGTRGFYFESCYGVSVKGGTLEDCSWAVEIQSSNVSYDGYMESHNRGNFCFTGNNGLLNVLNLITSNPGDRSVFFAPASDTRVLCQQITLYNCTDLKLVFEMRAQAVAYYALVRSDAPSHFEPAGDKFASYVSGIVASTLNSDPFPTLQLSTRPTFVSPVNGSMWWEETTKALVAYIQSIKQAISTAFYSQMTSVTVANTTTETTLLDVANGKGTATLPANFFADGKSLRLRASGVLSATGTPTLELRVKIGTTTFGITGSQALGGTISNTFWELDILLTCRSASASGSLQAQGKFLYDNAEKTGKIHGMGNASPQGGFNTTAAQTINILATWGTADAGNTIKCTNAVFETVNAVV